MKVTVQVVVQAGDDADAPSVVREVLSVNRDALAPDTLGLQRGEAMDLRSAVQGTLVEEQAKAALAAQVACPECGRPRAAQGLPHDRGAQPVRDPVAGQSAVVALWLPAPGQPDVHPRWLRCFRLGSRRSVSIWKRSSPDWSPTG
jgi:hypothetical protein